MSTPFRELLRRRRYPMDERIPDGRSVYELVNDVAQSPQVLTPQNQAAITRPRQVTQPEPMPEPVPMQGGFKAALTRPRRTQPRDFVADDTAYLRDVNKQPRTWRDKVMDAIDAVNAGLGNKPRILPTKRERAIREAEGQLATDLELQKQALSQMVPVTLEDGSQVMVPARQAGTLQSQQQRIRQQGEQAVERQRMNNARIGHWENMDAATRRRLLANLYQSGALNDPDQLKYAADELGIPGALQEKFIQGQLRDAIDESGNLIQVNRQTQKVLPVTRGDQPVGSYQKTQEAGRERRFQQREGRLSAPKPVAPDRATHRKVAQLIGQIEGSRREMELADQSGNKDAREKARINGEAAAAELNALGAGYEAGPGEGGYPYYKKGGAQPAQQGGRTIEGAIDAFTRKVGRAPTAEEVAKMKAALGQ